jgi:hypothetical protein
MVLGRFNMEEARGVGMEEERGARVEAHVEDIEEGAQGRHTWRK